MNRKPSINQRLKNIETRLALVEATLEAWWETFDRAEREAIMETAQEKQSEDHSDR